MIMKALLVSVALTLLLGVGLGLFLAVVSACSGIDPPCDINDPGGRSPDCEHRADGEADGGSE